MKKILTLASAVVVMATSFLSNSAFAGDAENVTKLPAGWTVDTQKSDPVSGKKAFHYAKGEISVDVDITNVKVPAGTDIFAASRALAKDMKCYPDVMKDRGGYGIECPNSHLVYVHKNTEGYSITNIYSEIEGYDAANDFVQWLLKMNLSEMNKK